MAALLAANPATGAVLTFSGLSHGEIVTTQLLPAVTISAVNPNRSHDLAIIFDSLETGTADPDLEGPPWLGGNLAPGTVLGNMLIIAENDVDVSPADGLIDSPDDEGNRPAGSLIFDFSGPITFFGFDIIDVEGVLQEGSSIDFFSGGGFVGNVNFSEFVTPGPLFDPTITFGNNTANRIMTMTTSSLGHGPWDKVVINLGGSAAIDNIVVPEPASVCLLMACLVCLGLIRRR